MWIALLQQTSQQTRKATPFAFPNRYRRSQSCHTLSSSSFTVTSWTLFQRARDADGCFRASENMLIGIPSGSNPTVQTCRLPRRLARLHKITCTCTIALKCPLFFGTPRQLSYYSQLPSPSSCIYKKKIKKNITLGNRNRKMERVPSNRSIMVRILGQRTKRQLAIRSKNTQAF